MSNDPAYRSCFSVITYQGGPEAYHLGRFHERLVELLNGLPRRQYSPSVGVFAFFIHIGASLSNEEKEGVLRVRLNRDGSIYCDIGIPERAWRSFSLEGLRLYYAGLLWDGAERIIGRIRKAKADFDEDAFTSDSANVMSRFLQESPKYPMKEGEREIRNRLVEYNNKRRLAFSMGEELPSLGSGAEEYLRLSDGGRRMMFWVEEPHSPFPSMTPCGVYPAPAQQNALATHSFCVTLLSTDGTGLCFLPTAPLMLRRCLERKSVANPPMRPNIFDRDLWRRVGRI